MVQLKGTVVYFDARAKAEAIRLTLAAAGADFENKFVAFADLATEVKGNPAEYPFAQVPRYFDGEVDLVQTQAILRYLGRRHGLAGGSVREEALVDVLLEGIADLKSGIVPLVYRPNLQTDEAKQEHWEVHVAPEGLSTPDVRGAHVLYLQRFIEQHGQDGFAVGGALTVADIALFDLVSFYRQKFGGEFDATYPALVAHHAKIAALPRIAAYLAGPLRPAK
ncbi:flagellar associated [Chlorella sorokiniana]|uniref:glutathione transferase n=1 Tax=Chlorella sorokiniana TaxID=3076 RepID=A0A2P6TVA0_CHLSO|nr:flagellar associated [Chlorella sorokiniana]|eukprot:PRW57978.1 flagellar associated [Chlorella sorokiniana]